MDNALVNNSCQTNNSYRFPSRNPSSSSCSSVAFSHFHVPLNSFACDFIPSFFPFPSSFPFQTSFVSPFSSPVPLLTLLFHKFSITRAHPLSLFPYSFFFVSPRCLPFFPFPFPFALPLQRTHHGARDNSTLMYSPAPHTCVKFSAPNRNPRSPILLCTGNVRILRIRSLRIIKMSFMGMGVELSISF